MSLAPRLHPLRLTTQAARSAVLGLGMSLAFVAAAAAQNPNLPTGEIPAEAGFVAGAQVGAQMPDVELVDATGATRRLSDLQGKVVLVNFWASWCGPCRREMPEFKSMRGEYAARGFEVVAVNVDRQRSRAAEFLAGIQPDFPVWYDPAAASMGEFGVNSMPTSFLIDRNGIVRHKVVGYREADLPTWRTQIEQWLAR